MANKETVASFLSFHIDSSGKTNKEISDEAGFARPNIISMLKSGVTRVPIARVTALAESIGVDPIRLFRLVMEEYNPEVLTVCDEVYGREKLSKNEAELIAYVRAHSPKGAPSISKTNVGLLEEWINSGRK